MSGTIQRSNNTAGRMGQVRVGAASLGPLRARSCTYIQGPSASEDSRAHANHLPSPPPHPASLGAQTRAHFNALAAGNHSRGSPAGGSLSQRVPLPVCVLLYVILRCRSTIKQTGVEGFALLPAGEDARQRAQPHLLFLLLTLRLLQIF